MNDNERIAEWAGIELVRCPLDFDNCSLYEIGQWATDSGYANGHFIWTEGKDDPEWNAVLVVDDNADDRCRHWAPDIDIALWHGPDGLLAEIEKKGLVAEFTRSILTCCAQSIRVYPDGSAWLGFNEVFPLLRADPAQLAAALCKVIEED